MQDRIGLIFTFLYGPFKQATVRKPKFKNIGDTWAIRPELQMIPIAYLISRNRLAVYFDNLPEIGRASCRERLSTAAAAPAVEGPDEDECLGRSGCACGP